MAKRTPFFSVVIPTRDRPELIQYCLESLALQTFSDFEVIVSDNHTGKPCKTVFDRFADERFKYATPPSPLSMHDNWEYACNFAMGEYLTVLIDKTILRPSALQIVNTTLNHIPAEMVSWWNENYYLMEEDHGYDKGKYTPYYKPRIPYYFDPREELKRRFRMDTRRGMEGVRYYWGKICFGFYNQNLIRRIKDKVGGLFYPFSPDYTSMLSALSYTRSAIDMGQPFTISFVTRISNGRLSAESDDYAFNFIKGIDPTLHVLDTIPLKRLYASSHNIVAADYLQMQERVGEPMKDLILSRKNLILRAREDLDRRLTWDDESRKKEQHALWNQYFSELSVKDRVSVLFELTKPKVQSARRALNRIITRTLVNLPGAQQAGKPYLRWKWARQERILDKLGLAHDAETKPFGNVLEAAKFADKYYENKLSLLFDGRSTHGNGHMCS